jgi:precorrin-6B methylase 2
LLSETDLAISLYVLAAFLGYFFLSGFIWGAGFQPTPKKELDRVAQLLQLKQGTTVYDLGSGTGQVVIHLARKYKVKCVGIEIDPLKVLITKIRIALAKDVKNLVEIRRANLFSIDISKADVIYLFLSGGTSIMKNLESKLLDETREGAMIVSYVHSFEDWSPALSMREIKIYSLSNMSEKRREK